MNKKLVLVTLISAVASSIPLYYFTLDYMSYLYWIKEALFYKCNGPFDGNCFGYAVTPHICKNAYEKHDDKSFHDVCTIYSFDGEYGSIQFASIGISMIPVVVSAGLLSAIYLRQKITTSK